MELGFISWGGCKSHGFLEMLWEPGVSSQVMIGMFFKHSCFLSDVRTPVKFPGTYRDSPRVVAGKYGCLSIEEGDPGSLSSCHWDNGIAIYFQEESGIVSC